MSWRYIAQRISGPNKGLFLDWNLPLSDVVITDAIGPGWLSASLSPDLANPMAEDGQPVLDKWSTAIWAEEDGVIRGGGILASNTTDGTVRSLECMGYAGYAVGIPYMRADACVGIDPIEIAQYLWHYIQTDPASDLGVVVTWDRSPVRIGTAEEPYKLSWWDVKDCGNEIDALATATPFEYRESHSWGVDNEILHRVIMAYPRLGTRRTDLRFVLGENLRTTPKIDDEGTRFANEILGIGAGEGRAMLAYTSGIVDHRLRRVHVLTDKSVTTSERLLSISRNELFARSGTLSITSVEIVDHPNAPLGSWQVGDEILVQVANDWSDVALWCRVISTAIKPEDANMATLTLERV